VAIDRQTTKQASTMIPPIDLHAEYFSIKAEIDDAIQNVLKKGQFILGENVKKFEEEFAAFTKSSFAIGVSNGTDALHLSLAALGVKDGDEVVTVANTAASTALAIAMTGARPVFADIDPITCTINPDGVQKVITDRTRAIIPVHLYGCPVDLEPLLKISRKAGIHVIEDACQAHGAFYKGKMTGTLGDVGCFSFYPTKNLGAYGDAGMIVTNDEELHAKIVMLRNLGQTDRYHHKFVGFNKRMDELQAAILRVKLRHLNEWNKKRDELAAVYARSLQGLPVVLPVNPDYGRRVYHLYVIHLENRDALFQHLRKREIFAEIHYPVPLHLQESFQYLGIKEGSLPISESSAKRVLTLPLYPQLKVDDIQQVVSSLHEYFTKEKPG
jgi:dTDP-4-amino-4,6-dideoxygalactose transaminase